MTAEDLEKHVLDKALSFGLFTQSMKNDGKRGTPNAVKRSNISPSSFTDGKAYFGFVRPEENPTGAYYDLSFVIFPQEQTGKCVVSIVVGSAGYQRDYDIASTAGIRRLYTRLTNNDGNSFIRNDFTDISSQARDLLNKISDDESTTPLQGVIDTYSKVILAARIVDPDIKSDLNIIDSWLAQYAKIRNWGNKAQIKAQNDAIKLCINHNIIDYKTEIVKLLMRRRFVVLQGAPGTGKTYNALEISKDYKIQHFIQFHAETTYSDFVIGIRPVLDKNILAYETHTGELHKAIKSALDNPREKVILIIDEINRANLANVLGPVFYLFENHTGTRNVKLDIGDGLEISKIPDNLYVIATMNTADRSLAVVDFALRRRFAWYTIRPQKIKPSDKEVFHEEYFNRFCEVFDMYATDEELNLQPGPAYFLTSKENSQEIIKDKMLYELMPLIKEYLSEGLMSKASDCFSLLFYELTGKYMYE